MPTHARVRAFLENVAKRQNSHHLPGADEGSSDLATPFRVTEALKYLMEEDAAADRPFIAALVISRARGACRRPGSFN
jgi:hypothetical protein